MDRRFAATVGLLSAAVLLTTGCAGGIGKSDAQDSAGEGVEYGASMEEYQAALADMTPVTLTYQAGSSASGHAAEREQAFADQVEEWSGDKITLEVVYGQPIAPFGEVVEAVGDGRIDIGMEVPIYTPEKYPTTNDLSTLMTAAPAGPLLDEVVGIAAAQEFAWNNEDLLEEFRATGAEPFIPVEFEFSGALLCTQKIATLDDMQGKQFRAGTTAVHELASAVGAAGVSLQSSEQYEALERGVVDCVATSLKTANSQGILPVAPHMTFPNDVSWGRSPVTWVTGPGFAEMPLAARQLVFDQLTQAIGGSMKMNADSTVDAAQAAEENGGGFYRTDDAADAVMTERLELMRTDGSIRVLDGEASADELASLVDKWTSIAAEEGLEDVDSWEDLAEKQESSDPVDFSGFAQRIYEEAYLPHRPS